MNKLQVTATDAKVRFGEILDIVTVENRPISITRHGKVIATINPVKTAADYERLMAKYAGSIPDFPDVTKDRTQNRNRFKDIF